MRGGKLTRAEAVEEYLVYQIKLFEYLHCFQVALDIIDEKYKPESPLGHGSDEFRITFFILSVGLFASLIDPQNMAVNVFDAWLVLYPGKKERILDAWKKIRPHMRLIRDFRSEVAFHANKNLRRYLKIRGSLQAKSVEVIPAMREFWDLAAELMKEQHKAFPDLGKEIDPILKKAVPSASHEQIERLKSVFILNKPASD
jgi:hypothetical protein